MEVTMGKASENKGIEFLEDRIGQETTLPEIVDVFKEMCKIPMNDTEELQLLFETGSMDDDTYTIHMVRQTVNPDEEEYFQVTVDVIYSLKDTENLLNKKWEHFWSFELENDFFEHIKNNQNFKVLKDKKPININIYLDET